VPESGFVYIPSYSQKRKEGAEVGDEEGGGKPSLSEHKKGRKEGNRPYPTTFFSLQCKKKKKKKKAKADVPTPCHLPSLIASPSLKPGGKRGKRQQREGRGRIFPSKESRSILRRRERKERDAFMPCSLRREGGGDCASTFCFFLDSKAKGGKKRKSGGAFLWKGLMQTHGRGGGEWKGKKSSPSLSQASEEEDKRGEVSSRGKRGGTAPGQFRLSPPAAGVGVRREGKRRFPGARRLNQEWEKRKEETAAGNLWGRAAPEEGKRGGKKEYMHIAPLF